MGRNRIGSIDDFQGTGMKKVEIEGRSILFIYIKKTFYAVDAFCSHKIGDFSRGSLNGFILKCPVHGSEFDIRTGEVVKNIKLPLLGKAKNLQAYDVVEEKGEVFIEL